MRAPWSSNYTININTEMNYWPAETTGLPELHEPLLTFIGELAVTGAPDRRLDLRDARLDGAPQLRCLASLRHGRRLGQRRPGVGDVADGRRRGWRSTCGNTTCSAATPPGCESRPTR